MIKYFISILLFFLISCDYETTRNFQEVELQCHCSEQQVLELIKMYEEYGFKHYTTKYNFNLNLYKIRFIKEL